MKFKVKQNYADLRRQDYPELRDQLDALWKGGEALDAMRQKVMDVKAKYPKPAVTEEVKP